MKRNNKITIKGKKQTVVENLGFVHSRGANAKVINYNGEERIVLKNNYEWELAFPIILPVSGFVGQ